MFQGGWDQSGGWRRRGQLGVKAIRWKAAADGWETLLLNGCKCRGAVHHVSLALGCLDLQGPFFAQVKFSRM